MLCSDNKTHENVSVELQFNSPRILEHAEVKEKVEMESARA
jgi:hypothetical protein